MNAIPDSNKAPKVLDIFEQSFPQFISQVRAYEVIDDSTMLIHYKNTPDIFRFTVNDQGGMWYRQEGLRRAK